MDKIMAVLDRYIVPPLVKLSEEKHLIGIRNGVSTAIPFVIIGSLFLLIANLPIPAWTEFIKPFQSKLVVPVSVTYDILSIIIVLAIAYHLAKEFNQDTIIAPILSLSSFLMIQITPHYKLNVDYFGAKGLFAAIIAAVITVEVLRFFNKRNIYIKMPKDVPPAVAKSFASLIPAAVIIIGLWIIRVLLNFDINHFIDILFQPLVFSLSTLTGILIFMFVRVVLWFIGIHGGAVLGAIADPILLTFLAKNTAAFQAGDPIPYITATGFSEFFVFLGGGGATLPLVFLLMRSKNKGFKSLGRLALPSSLFEINEPVVFGVPMVLNPLMMIPYMINELLLTLGTYILMDLGIIGKPVVMIPWTTPPIIGHYLATGGDWRAAVWGCIALVIAGLIYYPFFKAYEKQRAEQDAEQSLQTSTDDNVTI